jgi:hypothetical protein
VFRSRLLARVMRVAVAAGLCACWGCGDTALSSGSPQEAGGQDVPGPVIEHRLWRIAARAAEGMNGRIKDAQAVKSQHAAAVRLTSDAVVSGKSDVWAIQIEGVHAFVCRTCSFPAGARPPSGRFITLVIDAETFKETDFGIAPDGVDLGKLGTVIELHK